MAAVTADRVNKIYRKFASRRKFQTLKSAFLSGDILRAFRPDETFRALHDVSFDVGEGETFGIIGQNGSGKSTLLKIVAGISRPTTGTILHKGRISALIELGAGFHPEITGRENVYINGIMLGLTKKEIQRRFDEIVKFAELEDFIDSPVKTYSSGMYMRLGFAVAINVDPEILIIDEVLAVGDASFIPKCLDKIHEFRRRKKTIFLVTHGMDVIELLCDRALWLKKGGVQRIGASKMVCDAYMADVTQREEVAMEALAAAGETAPESAAGEEDSRSPNRWGSREIEIYEVKMLDPQRKEKYVFQTDDPAIIRIKAWTRNKVTDFVFGIGIFNTNGVCCYGTNSHIEKYDPVAFEGEGTIELRLDSLNLIEGTYFLDVATHRRDGQPYDYHRSKLTFRVHSKIKDVGVFRPVHAWDFSPEIRVKAVVSEAAR